MGRGSGRGDVAFKDGDMEFEFWCPWELCSALIGSSGEGIRKLRDTYRMHIEVNPTEIGCHRRCRLGPCQPGVMRDAVAYMFELFMKDKEGTVVPIQRYKEVTFSVALSHNEIGQLIGKGGETVKLIRQETSAKIKIMKENGEFALAPKTEEEEYSHGYVEVFGTVECLKTTFEMLIKAVCAAAQLKYRREHGGYSRPRSTDGCSKSRSKRRSRSRRSERRSRRRGSRSRRRSRSRGRRGKSRSRRRSKRSRSKKSRSRKGKGKSKSRSRSKPKKRRSRSKSKKKSKSRRRSRRSRSASKGKTLAFEEH